MGFPLTHREWFGRSLLPSGHARVGWLRGAGQGSRIHDRGRYMISHSTKLGVHNMREAGAVKTGALLFLVFFGLFGCTSLSSQGLPGEDAMRAEAGAYRLPKLPENGKAIVYVVRPSINCDTFGFSVFVDNQNRESQEGSTKGRQYIYFDLPPGEHKIFSRVDNWDTWAETFVSAKAGDILFVQQEPDMGFITLTSKLAPLPEFQGKYYVKTLTKGTIIHDQPSTNATVAAATVPPHAPGQQSATADIFTGTITGGTYAKGVGFTNLNVKLEVTSDAGERAVFYVRSDSRVVDARGKTLEYLAASRGKGKRVEIEYFTITDGTGGDPSRHDFAFEVGEKGVRVLRFLN
jgi:hypothetical protein